MKNGKAQNLAVLATIQGVNVPKFIVFNSDLTESESATLLQDFLQTVPRDSRFAVRSSADQEDSATASFAGMYATKLRVQANLPEIQSAISAVRASGAEKREVVSHYAAGRKIELAETGISVIIQEMVEADISGVVFSHGLSGNDGYYVVSTSTGIGETIVGGASNGTLTRIARGVKTGDLKEAWQRQLVNTVKKIEEHFLSVSLDIEFAFKNGVLYILQCRPITTVQTVVIKTVSDTHLLDRIESLNSAIASRFYGDVLGDMMDINPLELLGSVPTTLDISIFNHLFAEKIVERVRRDMGYDPLDVGLLRVVAGKPYTSMRATAFSFRPMGISNRIYERMVDVYREMLLKNPALQSRVEFDLYAMSCGEKLEKVMERAGLNEDDRRIVREAFTHIDTVFSEVSRSQAEMFETNAGLYEQEMASLDNAPLDKILEHVAVGTETFVRVARLAFYWKNKFQEKFPEESLDNLIAGHIQTVNGQLQADLVACRESRMTRDALVQRYGHLRPGQFSVFGESYADDPETYLFAHLEEAVSAEPIKCTHEFEGTIEFQNVITFMQARERMKFLFAQSLHVFATKLKHELAQRNISEQGASHASWDELNVCLRCSSELRTDSKDELPVLLPEVIFPGVTDLRVITFAEAMPSYITTSVVKTRICAIERLGVKADVKGALVLLPNADPGYDFLFHSGALGIITKVGGPASHMCIRSIELQMPACIGCGESAYQALLSARFAVLDCRSRQIIVLD